MLSQLRIPKNSRKKKKRLGRGFGSTFGKTSGKGHKGQNSRSGGGVRVGFEGGQLPIYMRLPKRGFFNPFRVKNIIISLDSIAKNPKLDKSKVIDRTALIKAGIINPNKQNPIKLLSGKLSSGEDLPEKMSFKLDAVSKQAKEKIIQTKGTVELTPKKEKPNFKANKKIADKTMLENKEVANKMIAEDKTTTNKVIAEDKTTTNKVIAEDKTTTNKVIAEDKTTTNKE